jgi:PhoPQ-activated pathogenicity-related protein
MIIAGLTLLLSLWQEVPGELGQFLKAEDRSFAWQSRDFGEGIRGIRLTSQTWRGTAWTHDLVLVQPRRVAAKGIATLVVTGGSFDRRDFTAAQRLTELTGVPTAVLFDIPNQPLFGKREDALIAHTFVEYLSSGDPTWPLLFPMVKSVIRAMDAIQKWTASGANPLERFVVTGASKRGWTAWLVGASGDRRVAGIAPMVFDMLRFPEQLRHQVRSWGKYSEMIGDYTGPGLPSVVDTEPGRKLVAMVDPFSYRAALTLPKLVITGSNDRYWTVDAVNQYWGSLRGSKWFVKVPNVGHDLGDGREAESALAAFVLSCAGLIEMPEVEFTLTEEFAQVRTQSPGFRALRIWACESPTLDFRESKWADVARDASGEVRRDLPRKEGRYQRSEQNQAVFAEAVFELRGLRFGVCSEVRINPKPEDAHVQPTRRKQFLHAR